jgi:signal transduction histidine kinase
MNMTTGAAYKLDESGQMLEVITMHSASPSMFIPPRRLPLAESAAGQAVSEQEPVMIRVSDYPPGEMRTLLESEGLQTVVSLPLMSKGRALGAINLACSTPREITPEEISLLISIGHQTGVAVENARLYERAEQSAAAAERSRLARELHDAVTQTLFSASLIAEVLPRLWERNPQEGKRRLEQLRHLTRGALAEMRTLLLELRPSSLIEASLPDLLRQLTEAASGRGQVPIALSVEGDKALPPELQVAVYRVAQEALNNIVKHAGASSVEVTYRRDEAGVELRIKDDGRGFDPEQISSDHLGLGIMEERAVSAGASLRITTAPGAGTELLLTWTEQGS